MSGRNEDNSRGKRNREVEDEGLSDKQSGRTSTTSHHTRSSRTLMGGGGMIGGTSRGSRHSILSGTRSSGGHRQRESILGRVAAEAGRVSATTIKPNTVPNNIDSSLAAAAGFSGISGKSVIPPSDSEEAEESVRSEEGGPDGDDRLKGQTMDNGGRLTTTTTAGGEEQENDRPSALLNASGLTAQNISGIQPMDLNGEDGDGGDDLSSVASGIQSFFSATAAGESTMGDNNSTTVHNNNNASYKGGEPEAPGRQSQQVKMVRRKRGKQAAVGDDNSLMMNSSVGGATTVMSGTQASSQFQSSVNNTTAVGSSSVFSGGKRNTATRRSGTKGSRSINPVNVSQSFLGGSRANNNPSFGGETGRSTLYGLAIGGEDVATEMESNKAANDETASQSTFFTAGGQTATSGGYGLRGGAGTSAASAITSARLERRMQRYHRLLDRATTAHETVATQYRNEADELVDSFKQDTIFRELVNDDDDNDDRNETEGEEGTDYEEGASQARSRGHSTQQFTFSSRSQRTKPGQSSNKDTTTKTGSSPALGYWSCTACDHKFEEPNLAEHMNMDLLRDIYHHCGSAKHRGNLKQMFPTSARLKEPTLDPSTGVLIHLNGIPTLVSKEFGGSHHFTLGNDSLTRGATTGPTTTTTTTTAGGAVGSQLGGTTTQQGFEGRAEDLLNLGSSLFDPLQHFATDYRLRTQPIRNSVQILERRKRQEFAASFTPEQVNPLMSEWLPSLNDIRTGTRNLRNFGSQFGSDLTGELRAFSRVAADRGMTGVETRMRLRKVHWGSENEMEDFHKQAMAKYVEKHQDGGHVRTTKLAPEDTQVQVRNSSSKTQQLNPDPEEEIIFSEQDMQALLSEELLQTSEFPFLRLRFLEKRVEKLKTHYKAVPANLKNTARRAIKNIEKKLAMVAEARKNRSSCRVCFEVPQDLGITVNPAARLRIDPQKNAEDIFERFKEMKREPGTSGVEESSLVKILEEGRMSNGDPYTVTDLAHTVREVPNFTRDPILPSQRAHYPHQQQEEEEIVAQAGGTVADSTVVADDQPQSTFIPELSRRIPVKDGDLFRLSWFSRGYRPLTTAETKEREARLAGIEEEEANRPVLRREILENLNSGNPEINNEGEEDPLFSDFSPLDPLLLARPKPRKSALLASDDESTLIGSDFEEDEGDDDPPVEEERGNDVNQEAEDQRRRPAAKSQGSRSQQVNLSSANKALMSWLMSQ